MRTMSNNAEPRSGKTKIVEIVGPAGAGKTTLYQALDCHADLMRLGNFPDVRKVADAPFFIWNGIRIIPSLLRLYQSSSRQLTRREFAWMSILYGWSELLCKESHRDNRVIVLDQGPVYLLAEMRLFGPEYLKRAGANGLWHNLYKRWGTMLDIVVWLDAEDEVLFHRIRNRQQEHIVKDQPATVVFEFLNCYRSEYERILSVLEAQESGLKILRFDTQQQPKDILSQLMWELHA
jgi:hypothetical protein